MPITQIAYMLSWYKFYFISFLYAFVPFFFFFNKVFQ